MAKLFTKHIVQKNELWLKFALKICGDKELSKDLVQDMYVKIHGYKKDTITTSYVYSVIKSVFIDYKKKKENKKIFVDLNELVLVNAGHRRKINRSEL